MVLHPRLSLRFISLEAGRCARVFHPGHDVKMSCQVSLLSGQQFASAVHKLRHELRSWLLNAVHVLERLGCKSCDYVRTMSVTQPKVSQRQRGKEMRRDRIKVVITV